VRAAFTAGRSAEVPPYICRQSRRSHVTLGEVSSGADSRSRAAVGILQGETVASNPAIGELQASESVDVDGVAALGASTPGPDERASPSALAETMDSTHGSAAGSQGSAVPFSETLSSSQWMAEAGAGQPSSTDDTVAPALAPGEASDVNELALGSYIGRLKLLRVLGIGGMGVVYAAYDPELNREVAVKLIRGERESASARVRLLREAQALAQLAHPNVVAVYDVGVRDGQVWLSMEFVVGRTLSKWLAEERPRWRQILAVLKQAFAGVMAAHAEGLLHRDIKPDNIMVGDDGRVRVMDFGLARADAGRPQRLDRTEDYSPLSVELTALGTIMGTPGYMAPEQFLGLAADERTDQFALGVTAWEALCGERPFAGKTFSDLQVAVTSGKRRAPAEGVRLPAWLRRIIDRSLDVERSRRFESLRVMLDAIEVGEQRARLQLIIAGLAIGVLALATLGIAAIVQSRTAAANEARALRGEARAQENEARARASEEATMVLVDKLEEEKQAFAEALSVQRGLRARTLIGTGAEAEALLLGVQAIGPYAGRWDAAPREVIEGIEQVLAHDLVNVPASHVLDGHRDYLTRAVYSPDGSRLATAGFDGRVLIWDPAGAELLAALDAHAGKVFDVAFSPDGRRLASAGEDHRVRTWDAESGELIATLVGHGAPVMGLAFSPAGTQLASAASERSVHVWDVQTGASLFTLAGDGRGRVSALAYTPDGARLVTGGADGKARVWSSKTGELLATLKHGAETIQAVAVSPDSARVATAGKEGRARVWALERGELVATLEGHEQRISDLAYSPDGTRLTTVSWDRTGRVYEAEGGTHVATLVGGHGFGLVSLAYAPDGASVATVSFDGSVAVWDAETGALRGKLRGHTGDVWSVAFAPDGRQLVTASVDHSARLWNVGDAKVTVLEGPEAGVSDFAYSPDHDRLATLSRDGRLRLWAADTGELERTLYDGEQTGHRGQIRYAPDGRGLAHVDGGLLRIWDTETGALRSSTRVGAPDQAVGLRYSPAGTRLYLAPLDVEDRVLWVHDAHSLERLGALEFPSPLRGHAHAPADARVAFATGTSTLPLLDPRTGSIAEELELADEHIRDVHYSPDGSELATLSREAGVRLWDAHRLTPRGPPLVGSPGVTKMAYAPSGSRIAALTSAGDVAIWDVQTGERGLTIDHNAQDGQVHHLTFSPEGSRLAIRGPEFLRVHDSETGELLSHIAGHGSLLLFVEFWPDGSRLTSLSATHTLEVWDATTGEALTRERVAVIRDDGSSACPIPAVELAEIACARLKVFETAYAEVKDTCDPLFSPQHPAAVSSEVVRRRGP